MAETNEEAIRTRAFELWTEGGEPAGGMDNFRYKAEKELLVDNDTFGGGTSAR